MRPVWLSILGWALLFSSTASAQTDRDTERTDTPRKQKVLLVLLRFVGDRVELAKLERDEAFPSRDPATPAASNLTLELTSSGGEVLCLTNLFDPRSLHYDAIDPRTGNAEGGIATRDEAILPVPVPDLPEARSLKVKRKRSGGDRPIRALEAASLESGSETLLAVELEGAGR